MSLGDLEGRENVGPWIGGGPRKTAGEVRRFPNKNVVTNSGRVLENASQSYQVLPANGNRNYLLIQNNSAGVIYVSFGSNTDDFNGIQIASGGNYEPWKIPNGSVSLMGTVAGAIVVIAEGVGPQS